MAGGVTYNEFLNSLGPDVYAIGGFHIQSQTLEQLLEPIGYNTFDVNGTQYDVPIIMAVDPYQFSSAINEDDLGLGLMLNSQSSFIINLLNNENIMLILCTEQVSIDDGFSEVGSISNYKRADDNLGQLDLYKDFNLCTD